MSCWGSALTRNRGFTAAAVLTLALGIGANTAMFSVVDGVLLKPLAYREPDRLVSLHLRITSLKNLGVLPLPPFVYDLWRGHATALESIAVVRPDTENLTGTGEPVRVLSARISASLFSTLGVRPAVGRPFLAIEDRYPAAQVVILSDGFWRRRFAADPAIIGRKILLNEAPYQVVGVMPAGFTLPMDDAEHASHFDVLLPAGIAPEQRLAHAYWGVARLKPGIAVEQARATLDANLATLNGGLTRNAIVSPLRSNMTERVRKGLAILMAAIGLVLLIACGNLANLSLSRALARRKELAIRAALGAGRGRIFQQLFVESLRLAALGGAAGVLCAGWLLDGILTQLPQELPRRAGISIDGRALVFSIALTFVSASLFASFPAWRFSKTDPQEALRQSARGATDGRGADALRRWLIAAQVAICTMLLIGAGLLLRSFDRILSIDPGFQTEHVLAADVPLEGGRYEAPARRIATYSAIEERLRGIPGALSAGAVSWLPLSGDQFVNPVFLPNAPLTPERIRNLPMAQIRYATPDYFRVMGIALRAGRIYSDSASDAWNAVLSAGAAKTLWPRDAIGQEFTLDESPHPRMLRVAGVVADVHDELQNRAPLMVYLPLARMQGMNLSFVVRTALPVESVARAVRQAVWQVDRNVPVTAIRPMRDIVAASTAQRRFQTLLLAGFAAVAVLLAACGIYGTVSYAVNQRRREIGIRMALGAQRRDVASLVLRQAFAPVAFGIAAGGAGTLALVRLLAGLLFGVGPADAATYSSAGMLVLAVAAVSCWLPARRAMRVDPAETMHCE